MHDTRKLTLSQGYQEFAASFSKLRSNLLSDNPSVVGTSEVLAVQESIRSLTAADISMAYCAIVELCDELIVRCAAQHRAAISKNDSDLEDGHSTPAEGGSPLYKGTSALLEALSLLISTHDINKQQSLLALEPERLVCTAFYVMTEGAEDQIARYRSIIARAQLDYCWPKKFLRDLSKRRIQLEKCISGQGKDSSVREQLAAPLQQFKGQFPDVTVDYNDESTEDDGSGAELISNVTLSRLFLEIKLNNPGSRFPFQKLHGAQALFMDMFLLGIVALANKFQVENVVESPTSTSLLQATQKLGEIGKGYCAVIALLPLMGTDHRCELRELALTLSRELLDGTGGTTGMIACPSKLYLSSESAPHAEEPGFTPSKQDWEKLIGSTTVEEAAARIASMPAPEHDPETPHRSARPAPTGRSLSELLFVLEEPSELEGALREIEDIVTGPAPARFFFGRLRGQLESIFNRGGLSKEAEASLIRCLTAIKDSSSQSIPAENDKPITSVSLSALSASTLPNQILGQALIESGRELVAASDPGKLLIAAADLYSQLLQTRNILLTGMPGKLFLKRLADALPELERILAVSSNTSDLGVAGALSQITELLNSCNAAFALAAGDP